MTTINVTESTTTVTTTNDVTTINISNTGLQGATGATGASGVIAVTSPITNSGSASSATIGINQSLLSITKSQVSDFTSGTVASANTALTAGTASYATTSGTALTISGTITYSQVSDFASGTVANISGTVTQAQVSGLSSTLAGYAALGSANTFTIGAQTIQTGGTANKGLTVRGAASQSANLLEIQNSAASTVVSVSSTGAGTFPQQSIINTIGTATVPLTVKGIASQSANLQEWQNSGATVVARVDSSGNLRSTVSVFGNTLETNSGYTSIREANSGGMLQITKQTAAANNPGAGVGRIYFRDGTNANTLKLVVRAGAAGAETTILDNIPT